MGSYATDAVGAITRALMHHATRFRDVREANGAEVFSFPQIWGSTALGFGGAGGQAMTTAQTVILLHDQGASVYWGGGWAYDCTPAAAREFATALRTPSRSDYAARAAPGLIPTEGGDDAR